MIVNMRAIGILKKYMSEEESQIEIKKGTSLRDLKKIIGMPQNLPIGFVVNGLAVGQDYQIKHNDAIVFCNVSRRRMK
ncbi:hypothetical protein ES705_49031 [subsurface metagenome]